MLIVAQLEKNTLYNSVLTLHDSLTIFVLIVVNNVINYFVLGVIWK